MGKIVSAFPGTGKSYFYAHAKNAGLLRHTGFNMPLKVADSDSSLWPRDSRKAPWPSAYIESVKALTVANDLVFVSTHKEVRQGLVDAGLPFLLVYPERDLKAEYMYRYRERGSSKAFIDLMDAKWDEFLADCESQTGCTHLTLKSRAGTLCAIADVLLTVA